MLLPVIRTKLASPIDRPANSEEAKKVTAVRWVGCGTVIFQSFDFQVHTPVEQQLIT